MIQQVNMVINRKELTIIISKLHVKFSLGRKKSDNELILIELLREEIQILILNSVMEHLIVILQYLPGKLESEKNIDFMFRFVILSSRNKILTKLKLFGLREYKYGKYIVEDYILNSFEPNDYETFIMLIRLVNMNVKNVYSNPIFLRMLLEHLVLRISSLLVYDIFLSKKVSIEILEVYSIDPLLVLSYANKIYPYLKWNSYLRSLSYKNKFVQFLTLTKSGITLNDSIVETLKANKTTHMFSVLISKVLKLFHLLISSLIHKLAKS